MTPAPPTRVPLAALLREKVCRDYAGAPAEDIELFVSLVSGEPRPDLLFGVGPASHIARYHLITAALIKEERWTHAFRSASRLERAERAYVRELREKHPRRPSDMQRTAAAVRPRTDGPDTPDLDPERRAAIEARVEAMAPEQKGARLAELLHWRKTMVARDAAGRPQDPPRPGPSQPPPASPTPAPALASDG